ncbi:MAG: class I SAM-dependent methyltransferase [Acidobacteria bacterium]|nr:class I SAM-dependent methyltransferase [Acidobacteriota bacterium]
MVPSAVSTTSDYTVRDQQRMTRAVNYFSWQARIAMAPLGRRIVEVGCGIGNFTRMIADRDLVIGLDIEPACIEQHKANFQNKPNVRSMVLDAMDPAFANLKNDNPDSVVCLNVLEHIEDDLGTLKAFANILPKGGKAVLIVPAFMALYGPIDKHLGHYRRYTCASFAATATQAGFKPVELRYMNTVGFFGWWVNAKILKREEQSEGQIDLFDQRIVPVMEILETWVTPPFGQSVFAVIEKL